MPPLNHYLYDQEKVLCAGNLSQSTNDDEAQDCGGDGLRESLSAVEERPLKRRERQGGNRRGAPIIVWGQNSIYKIPGRVEFSEQEIVDSWYRARDFANFRKEIILTADIFRIDPIRIDDIEYTMRGAEHRVNEVYERRNLLRRRARQAVLLEQEFQECMGEASADRLAEEYAQVSADAVCDAVKIAALDQMQASRFENEWAKDEPFGDHWISAVSSGDGNGSSNIENKFCRLAGQVNSITEVSSDADFEDSWLFASTGTDTTV
jgi:hypothetical protein